MAEEYLQFLQSYVQSFHTGDIIKSVLKEPYTLSSTDFTHPYYILSCAAQRETPLCTPPGPWEVAELPRCALPALQGHCTAQSPGPYKPFPALIPFRAELVTACFTVIIDDS